MEYSHLDDTEFPILRTAAPYALKNTFDYTRWVPNTKIHMVNVLWGGDYSNVVKFSDDATRDAWFDGIEDSYVVTLTSNARIVPDGTIKLPLPYDVAARYNYLYVDIPLATSQGALIQDETENGVRRWYFFVGDISYSAPNTTIVSVTPDVWTNFINGSRIQYMMLQRGHAPVANSDTDTYLANPIENNRYLLAPDVNFDDTSVVRDSTYVPFGNGDKWVCFASTCGYEAMFANIPGAMESGSGTGFTTPTFSDTSDWYGYQLQVNGFGFDQTTGYDSMKAYVDYYLAVAGNEPNGTCTFALPYDEYPGFMEDLHVRCPAFLRTIQALFVVDKAMLVIQTSGSFIGHTVYVVYGATGSVGNYQLSKSMFGYGSDFERFAKLYTYPYARLEVSDNSGKTAEVRIENTGSIGIQRFCSLAFPMLDCRVFLTGINGIGSQSYIWKRINGNEISMSADNGDWDKLMFDLNIPTYSLYMDGATAYKLDSYSTWQNDREQALANYHNSVRSANAAYTNGVASAANARAVAVNSANTALTNADASAATTQTNTNNAAQCAYDNVGLSMTANTANTSAADQYATVISNSEGVNSQTNTGLANRLSQQTTDQDNQTTAATTKVSGIGGMFASGFQGAASGGLLGAAAGVLAAGASWAAATDNATITIQANEAVLSATTSTNVSINSNNVTLASRNTQNQVLLRDAQTTNTNTCLDGQRSNNKSTANTNAANLYGTQTANASRTNSTAVSNADSTQSTSNANSTRSRQVSVLNAQESLIASQDASSAALSNASRRTPIKLTDSDANVNFWFGQNGVQFRLRTQSDSAIAQTAAQFARYGYALNQIWDVNASGLNLMRHFTYWKATDVWVDVRNVATSEVGDMLSDMFQNGVTVWSNPNEIGKVSVYDN